MQKTYYIIIAIISILCLLVSILHLRENELFSESAKKRFLTLDYFTIVEIIIDISFIMLEGSPNASLEVLYVLKSSEFIMNPILCLLTLDTFYNKSKSKSSKGYIKPIRICILVIIICNAVLQILSVFFKFMYYIDENKMYVRTDFTIAYAIGILVCVGLLVLAIAILSHNKQNLNKHTLWGFCLLFLFGFAMKMLFRETNFDWLCISIAFLLLIIYYFNASLRLDSLTQLLNRQVYDNFVSKINFTTLIIMIDANSFKTINDTYGHECGDNALRLLAHCILRAYGDHAYCFRIGGDEFCAVLKPDVFKKLTEKTKNCDAYAMAEQFTSRLNEIIQSNEDGEEFLKYGVSQGYAIYYLSSEYPSIENNMTIDKVLRLADKRMYQEKEKFKDSISNLVRAEDNDFKDSV